jgi:hypothetical protein
MTRNLTAKSASAMAFAAVSFAAVLGWAGECLAQTAVPEMTIEIYNDSCQPTCQPGEIPYNIYPVLSTGTSTPDKWMQAILGVPSGQVADFPYPKTNQFRLYINPTGDGIPPGGSIVLKFPFYSQLFPPDQVNPKLPNQYIDWWGGGRIELFDAPNATHQPPAALTADYTGTNPARKNQKPVTPLATAAIPSLTQCTPPPCQALTIFTDPAGLGNNEPTQLTEYTLGALHFNVTASEPYGLDLHNVDYDVSYVDATYLPAAMEPYNNDQVGYIGTLQSIYTFQYALARWLAANQGWPLFIDDQKTTIMKIPSPINIFGGLTNPTPRTDVTPQPWPPFNTLTQNFTNCVNGGTSPICSDILAVRQLFLANYMSCYGVPLPSSGTAVLLSHLYGWTPFVTDCIPNGFRLLADTPGYFTINPDGSKNYAKYQAVKETFDLLQYWPSFSEPPNGLFDPYLVLIHGENYLNIPNAYAYSVDDALGNMQVTGDGLIIAVGGGGGLPNGNPATPPIDVALGYSRDDTAKFTKYGICRLTPNTDVVPTYPGFAISSTDPQKCPISLVDNFGQSYFFRLTSEPPYPPLHPPPAPPNPPTTPGQDNYAPVDCSDNAPGSVGAGWCKTLMGGTVLHGVFVYTVEGLLGARTNKNYAVTAPAVKPPGQQ